MGRLPSVQNPAGYQQAKAQNQQIHALMAPFFRAVLRFIEPEAQYGKQRKKYPCHQKQAKAVNSERNPFIQHHGEKEYRLFRLLRKVNAKPCEFPMTLQTNRKGGLLPSRIHLKAPRSHRPVSVGLITDAYISGQNPDRTGCAHRNAAHGLGQAVKRNGRILWKQRKRLSVISFHF